MNTTTTTIEKETRDHAEAGPEEARAQVSPAVAVMLTAREIKRDEAFNSRKKRPAREANEDVPYMTDIELDTSIRETGLLVSLRVRRLEDGTYTLVAGFRRHASLLRVCPDTPQLCSVQPSQRSDLQVAVTSRVENLSENFLRENLKPWEVAESLYQMKQLDPKLSAQKIADRTGISKSYINNLIRLRSNLAPKLWKRYQKNAEDMNYQLLVKVCGIEDHEKQIELYEAAVAAAEAGEAGEGGGGAESGGESEDGAPKGGRGGGIGFSILKGQEVAELRSRVRRIGIEDPEHPKGDVKGRFWAGVCFALDVVMKKMAIKFESGTTEE